MLQINLRRNCKRSDITPFQYVSGSYHKLVQTKSFPQPQQKMPYLYLYEMVLPSSFNFPSYIRYLFFCYIITNSNDLFVSLCKINNPNNRTCLSCQNTNSDIAVSKPLCYNLLGFS